MASEDSHFDYLVIGGGSGGIASARRAATYGAKVAVIEKARLGGTCVNVGCVPKKVMFNVASTFEAIHQASHFDIAVPEGTTFNWTALKAKRDAYVKRLNGIYESNLEKAGVTYIAGEGKFAGPKSVSVGDKVFSADHILIAVGGAPAVPPIPGAEHVITSDGFFDLETQPGRVAIVGGGYIAVELAGVFKALGSAVSVFVRRENGLMAAFDPMLGEVLHGEYVKLGVDMKLGQQPSSITKNEDGSLTVAYTGGNTMDVDCVLYATGRRAITDVLNLDKAGVAANAKGLIEVDEYHNTTAEGVYSIGDDIGKADLTPVAIKAGRILADRLFGGRPLSASSMDYDGIPSVVFSHPPIGSVGITEPQAIEKYGEDNITIYRSKFSNLFYGPWQVDADAKPKTAMKVICEKSTEKVLGIHVIGMGADEMMQGFGVAFAMGCTKADLDSCVAIHPTAAEELVTLAPWGMSWKNAAGGAGAGSSAL